MKALRSIIFLVLIILPLTGKGQGPHDEIGSRKRTQAYGVVHYAGSIGFLSAGVGLMNSGQTRSIEFLIGYLPESIGGDHVTTLNWRAGVSTRTYPLTKNLRVQPLNVNIGISYSLHCDYDVTRPAVFSDGYYWWSEAIRANLNVGSTLMLNKTYSVYYEVGTNELMLVSYVLNANSLSVVDILHLGIGMRFKI